tara:strand:+ start:947 stop:1603 length:657 start_codon:yes stop_codon:yes gene_type:complete
MAASGSYANYASGHWGKGQLDIKQLAEKYGLDRSNPGRTEHDIYGKDADGNEVYIGRSNMGMASNQDLIAAHSAQAHPDEGDHLAQNENLSSSGDIRGAILHRWDGSAAEAAPGPVQPSQDLVDQKEDFKSIQDDFDKGNLPRMNTEGNPYTDAISHGDDLNEHYQSKFLPYIRKGANLAATEIGETGRYNLDRFVGSVPKLGDPKEMFEYYSDKIKD